jgi:hypothetical protein
MRGKYVLAALVVASALLEDFPSVVAKLEHRGIHLIHPRQQIGFQTLSS